MKKGWEIKRLDEIAEVGAGNPAPQDKALFDGGKYPFIRTSDVGLIKFGAISGSADKLNESGIRGLKLVPAGTILMPKSGASTFLNHRVITECDAYVSSHLATVHAHKGIADPRFLLFALNQVPAQTLLPENSYPSLNLALINGIEIAVPPIEEQQRIVAILDEAFAGLDRARAHAEANLQNARELFENSLVALFDELEPRALKRTLAEASTYFGRGRSRHRPRNDPSLYGGHIPFVQTGDIRNSDGTVVEFTQTYNEDGLAQSKLWPAGTICITIAANIAETAVLGFDACFPDSIIGMVVDPEIAVPEYVEFMLRYFAAELKALGKGSAQDNINLATFERATFPFPSLEEQRKVVETLSRLASDAASLSDGYRAKLRDLDDLRQSLLQKAFAGELTRISEPAYAA